MRDDEIENRHEEIIRESKDYEEYLKKQKQWHKDQRKTENRNRGMAKSSMRLQKQAEQHAPQQMKEGFFSRFKNRNSPERRKERISNLELEAKEESLKTNIHKSKQARGGSGMGNMFFGDAPKSSSRSSGKRRSKGYGHVPDAYQGMSQSDMSSSVGLNEMFGTGSQTKKSSRRSQPKSDGLSDMFGI